MSEQYLIEDFIWNKQTIRSLIPTVFEGKRCGHYCMKAIAIGLIGVGVLGSAVWGSLAALNHKVSVAPALVTTPLSVPQTQANETSRETCGDPPSAGATWYGVFIDGGNLDEIHQKYCKDAIAITRQNSGKASIQVASFSDRGRAEDFARRVSGEASRYEPNQKELTVTTAPEYSPESLNAAFLEVQNKTPGFPDNPALRRMIRNLLISYCENRKKGISDEKLLGQALKAIMQTDSTDEVKIMSSALAGTIIYAAKTHVCPSP
jgi:hypothetical protein